MGVITRKTYEHHRGLIFLGLFSFFISCWFLTDTLWVYNTICDIYVIEISAKIFLTAAVPCFMMYVYDFFNIYHKKLYSILIIIGFFFFALFFVLDLTGVLSYSYTINFIHAYILTSGITTLVEMISYLSKINGNKGESRIFNLGVTFFVFFSLFDIGRFYQGNEGDSSLMTRFGMFILIVTSIAVISTDIIAMLKLAVEAGKIGKIAYTDANTGLGNPAAFKEKFEFLDRTKNNSVNIRAIKFFNTLYLVFLIIMRKHYRSGITDFPKSELYFGYEACQIFVIEIKNYHANLLYVFVESRAVTVGYSGIYDHFLCLVAYTAAVIKCAVDRTLRNSANACKLSRRNFHTSHSLISMLSLISCSLKAMIPFSKENSTSLPSIVTLETESVNFAPRVLRCNFPPLSLTVAEEAVFSK